MEIVVKQDYIKQVGNVRLSEEIYAHLEKLAKEADVSIQTIIRAILEEAVFSGLVIKK